MAKAAFEALDRDEILSITDDDIRSCIFAPDAKELAKYFLAILCALAGISLLFAFMGPSLSGPLPFSDDTFVKSKLIEQYDRCHNLSIPAFEQELTPNEMERYCSAVYELECNGTVSSREDYVEYMSLLVAEARKEFQLPNPVNPSMGFFIGFLFFILGIPVMAAKQANPFLFTKIGDGITARYAGKNLDSLEICGKNGIFLLIRRFRDYSIVSFGFYPIRGKGPLPGKERVLMREDQLKKLLDFAKRMENVVIEDIDEKTRIIDTS
ncbi:MAG: hypothetical protein AB1529_03265 [Candidatus Micrarchaeota archaeon]